MTGRQVVISQETYEAFVRALNRHALAFPIGSASFDAMRAVVAAYEAEVVEVEVELTDE